MEPVSKAPLINKYNLQEPSLRRNLNLPCLSLRNLILRLSALEPKLVNKLRESRDSLLLSTPRELRRMEELDSCLAETVVSLLARTLY